MDSEVFTQDTEAAILARVIEADEKEVTPEIARYLLSMQLGSDENSGTSYLPRYRNFLFCVDSL